MSYVGFVVVALGSIGFIAAAVLAAACSRRRGELRDARMKAEDNRRG